MYGPNCIILFHRNAKMIEFTIIDITFTLFNNQVFISKLQMGLKNKIYNKNNIKSALSLDCKSPRECRILSNQIYATGTKSFV